MSTQSNISKYINKIKHIREKLTFNTLLTSSTASHSEANIVTPLKKAALRSAAIIELITCNQTR
jgi:hypothetical protein